jgi:hypothetical protein
MTISSSKQNCQVCGAQNISNTTILKCHFCGFKKDTSPKGNTDNKNLLSAEDINVYFKMKHTETSRGQMFSLTIPVTRFYKTPIHIQDQVNFFKSKNIMFLLEQHGFQMVSRKSRFSTILNIMVRKI